MKGPRFGGLIVDRAPGEGVMIGDDIAVRVLERRGRNVRIQIVAPPSVKILRTELWTRNRSRKPAPSEAG